MENKQTLKRQIEAILHADQKLSIKWDCGNDEALTTVFINDEALAYNDEFQEELSMYILNYLDLPDAGDFQMEGGGVIIKEQGQ